MSSKDQVVDEMFPDFTGNYMEIDELPTNPNTSEGFSQNDNYLHADFYNKFDDLFNDEDLD